MAGLRPGPLPKPTRRRRNKPQTGPIKVLPRGGRKGPTPRWPLPLHRETEAMKREAELWKRLWKKPVAVSWEDNDVDPLDVAVYVRIYIEGIRQGNRGLLQEARNRADLLALTVPSMKRQGMTIAESDDEEQERDEEENVVDIRYRLVAQE